MEPCAVSTHDPAHVPAASRPTAQVRLALLSLLAAGASSLALTSGTPAACAQVYQPNPAAMQQYVANRPSPAAPSAEAAPADGQAALAQAQAQALAAQAQAAQAQLAQVQAGAQQGRGTISPMPGAPPGQVLPPALEGSGGAAFESAFQNMLPLTPEMIKELNRRVDQAGAAAAAAPNGDPRPATSSQTVSLEPGMKALLVNLAPGRASVVTFRDVTGQPWPVDAVVAGNPQHLSIIQPRPGSSSLTVTPLTAYPKSNMVVFLAFKEEPVVFEVRGSSGTVDYQINLTVAALGPHAKVTVDTAPGLPANATPDMLAMLDGVPPEGAVELEVSGGQARAWRYAGKLYLRTRTTVISPSYHASISGAAGYNLYQMPSTPVVLASSNGQIVELTIAD
jgi:intracellular multiplication protein IcmK